jgi:hypothetical protein
MLADDVACNPRNSFPGTIYANADRKLDLYGDDIEVDYRGYEVSVESFMRLMIGKLHCLLPCRPRERERCSQCTPEEREHCARRLRVRKGSSKGLRQREGKTKRRGGGGFPSLFPCCYDPLLAILTRQPDLLGLRTISHQVGLPPQLLTPNASSQTTARTSLST